MRLRRRPVKVRVIYKNGREVVFRCRSFRTRKMGAELVEVGYENAKPHPYLFGVDDVAAIWVKGGNS